MRVGFVHGWRQSMRYTEHFVPPLVQKARNHVCRNYHRQFQNGLVFRRFESLTLFSVKGDTLSSVAAVAYCDDKNLPAHVR
jgi:hypothetical protein